MRAAGGTVCGGELVDKWVGMRVGRLKAARGTDRHGCRHPIQGQQARRQAGRAEQGLGVYSLALLLGRHCLCELASRSAARHRALQQQQQ